jgi:methionine biosynthesis protein MetW
MVSSAERFQNSQWQKLHELCFSKQVVLRMIEPGSVLDIGCGDGQLLEALKQRGIEGVGLDISSTAIAIGVSRGLDCRWHDLSEPLPFQSNSFDTVVLTDVLEHLFQPAETLKEVYRVCAKDILVSVPNFASLPARIQVLQGKVPENNTPRDGHVYWMTHEVLTRLLTDAGFEVEQLVTNTIWMRLPILGACTRYLSKVWPALFGLSFVVKARKCAR